MYRIQIVIACLVFLLHVPLSVHAQSQSISVTPPLFQLSVKPGDIWQSSVSVINSNEYPLTVYAEAVNFSPDGEHGAGKFMPILDTSGSEATLAQWIEIPSGPYTIPQGESMDIRFFVDVPEDAAPGGHFAAILISTEQPKDSEGSLALITTQTVTALFFTRIEGDVIEKADIREFTVLDRSVELPEAEFSLRFENKGNVHLQPRGDIVITNMWGKNRGIIPINHNTHFGNVLPESIRDFHFSWKGERSLADIGRYKAVVTLAYGENGVKSATATTYFWIIPVKGTIITLGTLALLILAISWMIRRYVRNMLLLAGVDPDHEDDIVSPETEVKQKPELTLRSYKTVSAPLRSGAAHLRTQLHNDVSALDVLKTIFGFVAEYPRFFAALIILIAGFVGVVLYVGEVANTNVEYEITIDEGDSTRTLTDDEVRAVRGE